MQLENIEWTRVWREEVNQGKKRVLLIGDSIIDGTKSLIGQELADIASISAFITSKALDNPWYLRELDLLLEQEGEYAAVYFNNGLHTGGLSPAAYREHYDATLRFLKEKFPTTPILLGLSTPVAVPKADPGVADAPITVHVAYGGANALVKAFNEEVKAAAREFSLPFFDAYQAADSLEPTLRTQDGYHYTEEGCRRLARDIARAIRKILPKE